MKVYADTPGARVRQIVTDLLAAAWTYLWITIAIRLYRLVDQLAVPGRKLEDAGNGLARNLSGAGDRAGDVPVAGKALAAPLRQAAGAARDVAGAGHAQQSAVHDLALLLAVLLVVVPLGLVVFGWLPLRVRWMRRASLAARLRADDAGRDLLALRALARAPLRQLRRLDPEIADGWRRGDPEAVDRLAALELRSLGLRRTPGRANPVS